MPWAPPGRAIGASPYRKWSCDQSGSGPKPNPATFGNRGRFLTKKSLVVAFVDPTGISQTPLSAMKALAKSSRIDLLVTIQYRLGIVWNVPQYFKSKSGQTALDDFLGDQIWHEWENKEAGEFGRLAVEHFCDKFQRDERFIATQHISVPEQNPFYRFTLFSRHSLGKDFWNKILKISETGQRELL
jgi:three-Cys-motif partner protein